MGECRFLSLSERWPHHLRQWFRILPNGPTGPFVEIRKPTGNHKKEVIELRLPFTRRQRVDRNYRRERNYEWERAKQALRSALVFLFLSFVILGLAFARAWNH